MKSAKVLSIVYKEVIEADKTLAATWETFRAKLPIEVNFKV